MAAYGVGNCGAAGGGVAVITGKDDALNAMNRSRTLRPDSANANHPTMASRSESRIVVGRVSLASAFADFTIICVLGMVVLFLYLFGKPFHRGFFCDDDSIRYPYKDDTVSSAVLITFAVCVPFTVVLLSELVALKREGAASARRVAVGPWTIPIRVTHVFYIFALYLFGLGAQQVFVDAGKHVIGRLRPHFLDVCKPSPPVSALCGNASLQGPPPNAGIFFVPFAQANPHTYITDFQCTGPDYRVRESRLSFPSGHSSMSFYAAIFTVMFLWRRFKWRPRVRLQLAFLQLVPLMMAWMTALSRVSDNKHHWSDVLTGCLIGGGAALITVLRLVLPGGTGSEAAGAAVEEECGGAGDATGMPALRGAPSCDTYETLFVI